MSFYLNDNVKSTYAIYKIHFIKVIWLQAQFGEVDQHSTSLKVECLLIFYCVKILTTICSFTKYITSGARTVGTQAASIVHKVMC